MSKQMSDYFIIEDNISIAGQLRRWAREADREGFAHTDEILEGADRIEKLEDALKKIAHDEVTHTKLNQQRLCCKFQSIAMEALNND